MPTLDEQRASFIRNSGSFTAFPLAGAIVWLVVGIASLFLPERTGLFVVLFGTGAIFPLALLFARVTGQQVFQPGNSFSALMGLAVLMVNLLWALHLTLLTHFPSLAPLSIALALGIHWIVFGWIIGSSIGLIHAIGRTFLCTAAFFVFPAHQICAVSVAVVLCYAVTICQLLVFFKIPLRTNHSTDPTQSVVR